MTIRFPRRRFLHLAAGAAALPVLPRASLAQAYPNRPITLIVPFPPGGSTDVAARIAADHMSRTLGQQIVVQNVSGAGGTTGSARAMRSDPDGYTILMGQMGTHAAAVALYPNLAYKPAEDFETIGLVTGFPIIIAAKKDFPAKDLKEFVAHAKTTPTPLFYGSTGPGSILHLMGELLKRDAGIKMDHVPYRGAAPLVTDLIAGRVQFGGDQLSSSLERVRSGQIKAMAVATKSVALPSVPTVRELGYPNLELQGWNGFLAPKATPEPVIARLQQEIAAAVKNPEVQKRMIDVGAEPSGSTQAEMRDMLLRQVAQIRPVVEELKLLVE